MVVAPAIAEQRVVLHNISWQTFMLMLSEMGEDRTSRLAYDKGTLEIMSPLMPHERGNRQIERLIFILAEELSLNLLSVGSMTCKREDLEKGVEPDSSYYLENEPLVRGKEIIDLAVDPPPDLVVEVEYSSSAINKLEIYRALGIPEIWRYNGSQLQIYRLENNQYILSEISLSFPGIALKEIPDFLAESRNSGEIAMTKVFRNWVKKQLKSGES